MSDGLKDLAIAFFGLALVSGVIQQRIERDVRHDLAKSLRGGHLEASVRPRGLFGLLMGEGSEARIRGHGFTTESLPFQIQPGGGLRARVQRLRLDFDDITLRALPVRRFHAEIPGISLDIGRALFDQRLILRGAGQGSAEAIADMAGLRAFLARKYPQFTDVEIRLTPGLATVIATTSLLGIPSRIEASGRLAAQDGRYVVVTQPILRVDGQEVPPLFAANLIGALNPILDLEKDLGLGSYFEITGVEIGEGQITLRGRAKIPRAEKGLESK